MAKSNQKKLFVMPHNDTEARESLKILWDQDQEVLITNQDWGASCEGLEAEVKSAIKEWRQENPDGAVYFFEMGDDLPEWGERIDHHGQYAGRPPSIIQICAILGVEPSRDDILTGAKDAGYVYGLESIGASQEEIAGFLGLDAADGMSMQDMLLAVESGFGDDVIAEAERAVADREEVGEMIVVRSAHSKTGPITTRLLGEQSFQNILILSEEDGEVNYYGTGETVRELLEQFPTYEASWSDEPQNSWSGGAGLMPHTSEALEFWTQWGGKAPNNGFFGGYPDQQKILDYLSKKFG